MQVVSHEEAMAALDYAPLIDHLHECHLRPPALVADSWLAADGNGLLARTGFSPGDGLGIKLASVFPGNVELPTVHSLYVLFDPATGEEAAVVVGNAITWFKTACDSALGTRRLARPDSRRLLMVGAGSMAPHLIRAHLAACPTLDRVTIWNRTEARARVLAAGLADLREARIEVDVATDLAGAAGTADVISVATMTVEPLLHGEWISPGTHVDLVGAYTHEMREADDDLIARGRLFVDSRDTTMSKTGELAIPLASGVITADDVLGDHYELAAGSVEGRTSDDDVTVFKNGGGGHLDLMTARFVLDRI